MTTAPPAPAPDLAPTTTPHEHFISLARSRELFSPAYDRLVHAFRMPGDAPAQRPAPPTVVHGDMWSTMGAILREMLMTEAEWRHAACAAADLMSSLYTDAEEAARDSDATQRSNTVVTSWFETILASQLSCNGRLAFGGFALAGAACALALLRHLSITVGVIQEGREKTEDAWVVTDALLLNEPQRPFFGWHCLQTGADAVDPKSGSRGWCEVNDYVCLVCAGYAKMSVQARWDVLGVIQGTDLRDTLVDTVANVLSLDLENAHRHVISGVQTVWPTAGGSFCRQDAHPNSSDYVADFPVMLAQISTLFEALEHAWKSCILRPRRIQQLRSMLMGRFTTRERPSRATPSTIVEHETDENALLGAKLRGMFVRNAGMAHSITLANTGTSTSQSSGYGGQRANGTRTPHAVPATSALSTSSPFDSDSSDSGGGDDGDETAANAHPVEYGLGDSRATRPNHTEAHIPQTTTVAAQHQNPPPLPQSQVYAAPPTPQYDPRIEYDIPPHVETETQDAEYIDPMRREFLLSINPHEYDPELMQEDITQHWKLRIGDMLSELRSRLARAPSA